MVASEKAHTLAQHKGYVNPVTNFKAMILQDPRTLFTNRGDRI